MTATTPEPRTDLLSTSGVHLLATRESNTGPTATLDLLAFDQDQDRRPCYVIASWSRDGSLLLADPFLTEPEARAWFDCGGDFDTNDYALPELVLERL